MRGRPNDPAVAKAKARKHAKYGHYCSCGKVVHGNGGKSAHAEMHRRRKDGGHFVSRETFENVVAAKTQGAAEVQS